MGAWVGARFGGRHRTGRSQVLGDASTRPLTRACRGHGDTFMARGSTVDARRALEAHLSALAIFVSAGETLTLKTGDPRVFPLLGRFVAGDRLRAAHIDAVTRHLPRHACGADDRGGDTRAGVATGVVTIRRYAIGGAVSGRRGIGPRVARGRIGRGAAARGDSAQEKKPGRTKKAHGENVIITPLKRPVATPRRPRPRERV